MDDRRIRIGLLCLLLVMGSIPNATRASEDAAGTEEIGIAETIVNDYRAFYSRERLTRMGLGFGAGAIVANTNIDRYVQNRYQNGLRNSGTDDFGDVTKLLGEGKYLIPIALLSAGTKYIDDSSPIGAWGAYTSRAYLTGGPAALLMQRVTGGSRPGESGNDSRWRPFDDNNGVSGHAFIGAVPFLTLSRMIEDNDLLKYLAYAGSFLAAWSRVNDDSHYLSQAALGWYMAWESVDAVFASEKKKGNVSIVPTIDANSSMLSLVIEW